MRELEELFVKTYNVNPDYEYVSPARINLIGEHIDYNGGMVLPAAISRYITALVSKRNDNLVSFRSTAFKDTLTRPLNDLDYNDKYDWANYGFGIFYMLQKEGYKIPFGLNILITSNIPLGSGLSSSAAFLDLIAYIANDIYKLGLTMDDIVHKAQATENVYCGLKCGVMDEAAIALGKENHCLLLNCNTFKYEQVPFDLGKYKFVVLQTNKPRKLTESKYNERVEECEKSLKLLQNGIKDYKATYLCDYKSSQLDEIKKVLNDEVLYKRTKHCILEQERVYAFVDALKKGNLKEIGALLKASHESLRVDYEVTGLHLDTIVNAALEAGAIGARMTGAGFGGCAIALVDENNFDDFKEKVTKKYASVTGINPDIYMVDIVSGPRKMRDYK